MLWWTYARNFENDVWEKKIGRHDLENVYSMIWSKSESSKLYAFVVQNLTLSNAQFRCGMRRMHNGKCGKNVCGKIVIKFTENVML